MKVGANGVKRGKSVHSAPSAPDMAVEQLCVTCVGQTPEQPPNTVSMTVPYKFLSRGCHQWK